jgi:Putative Actinobacterial Holin-X, holin superfamily III
MSENGGTRPESADKPLGEIVSDVTEKAQLLVREEIALAKAEVALKVSRIAKGGVAFALAGFFALMMLIFLLHTLSWGFASWLGVRIWVGFGITTGLLLLLAGLAALFGIRMIKKGTPPVPELAIEEAQKTRKALEEARR